MAGLNDKVSMTGMTQWMLEGVVKRVQIVIEELAQRTLELEAGRVKETLFSQGMMQEVHWEPRCAQ